MIRERTTFQAYPNARKTLLPSNISVGSGMRGFRSYSHRLMETVGRVMRVLAKAAGLVRVSRSHRRLRISETVSLGDKRFMAIVSVDQQEFLIGGSFNSICLLAQLEMPSNNFADALKRASAQQGLA